MPYKDPARQRAAQRASKQRRRAVAVGEARDGAGALPEPPDRDEVLRLLGVAARSGSVTAMKALLDEYRRDGDDTETKPTSVIDELAQRRTA